MKSCIRNGIPVSTSYIIRFLKWIVLLLALNQVIYAAIVPVFFFQSPFFSADYAENISLSSLEEILIDYEDGNLHGWKYGIRTDVLLLYFGGDNSDTNRWIRTVMNHNPERISDVATVLTVDYPTFGKSTGVISEESFYKTAILLYDYAKSRYPDAEIIPAGYSIGTAAALRLACVRECKALVLTAPMYDGTSLYLKRNGLLYSAFEPFASVKMQNDDDARRCYVKTMVIASNADQVTKLKDVTALCGLFPNQPELIVLNDCTHSDFWDREEVYDSIASFIGHVHFPIERNL